MLPDKQSSSFIIPCTKHNYVLLKKCFFVYAKYTSDLKDFGWHLFSIWAGQSLSCNFFGTWTTLCAWKTSLTMTLVNRNYSSFCCNTYIQSHAFPTKFWLETALGDLWCAIFHLKLLVEICTRSNDWDKRCLSHRAFKRITWEFHSFDCGKKYVRVAFWFIFLCFRVSWEILFWTGPSCYTYLKLSTGT